MKIYTLEDYKNIIKQIPNPVVITNGDGYIKFINESFTYATGYKISDIIDKKIGKKYNILYSGEHSDEIYHSMWKTIKDGRVFTASLKNKKEDGSIYWQNTTITPIQVLIDDQVEQYFLASINDITETRNYSLKLSTILEYIGKTNSIIILNDTLEIIEIVSDGFIKNYLNLSDYLNKNIKSFTMCTEQINDKIVEICNKIDKLPNDIYIETIICDIDNKTIDVEVTGLRFNSNKYMFLLKDVTSSRDFIKIKLGIDGLNDQITRLIQSRL